MMEELQMDQEILQEGLWLENSALPLQLDD